VIYYEGDIEGENIIIEFLTDQRGASEDVAIEVQKGLHAVALRFVSVVLENPIDVEIDDLVVEGQSQRLRIRVPAPEAYIFHKGLVFSRRKNPFKKAKDLYYIFDILANCPDLYQGIIDGLRLYGEKYSPWFPRFVRNMETYFSDINAKGIAMVSSQRPENTFPELTADQFKQYILGKFQEMIENIKV